MMTQQDSELIVAKQMRSYLDYDDETAYKSRAITPMSKTQFCYDKVGESGWKVKHGTFIRVAKYICRGSCLACVLSQFQFNFASV